MAHKNVHPQLDVFACYDGTIRNDNLEILHVMDAEEIAGFDEHVGNKDRTRCYHCKKLLKDEVSKLLGYGPTCGTTDPYNEAGTHIWYHETAKLAATGVFDINQQQEKPLVPVR